MRDESSCNKAPRRYFPSLARSLSFVRSFFFRSLSHSRERCGQGRAWKTSSSMSEKCYTPNPTLAAAAKKAEQEPVWTLRTQPFPEQSTTCRLSSLGARWEEGGLGGREEEEQLWGKGGLGWQGPEIAVWYSKSKSKRLKYGLMLCLLSQILIWKIKMAQAPQQGWPEHQGELGLHLGRQSQWGIKFKGKIQIEYK